ncbi:MAG: acyltransferase family protein [Planctomycetia bacterium]|nr:acyltransferase family protein [Planctomycetia bacterium]
MLEFKYRPDIDGLRAIAVLLVLFFHANFGFSGGYVGVDVFFVISGFLITGLILKEQRSGTFSLAGFWERRIRRILPAVICLVAVTLVVGILLLLPYDLEKLAESTVAQQLMLANVYFWRNTRYFDGAAELKPLLHMWSLAVEEQFYLGFPFLLLACKRLQRSIVVSLLCGLGLASFAVSVWGSYSHRDATFYLLPTRAWELLAGSILVFCPAPSQFKPWQVDLIGWLGLGGIFFAALSYNSSTRFPGSAALLPCLGTVLVVYSNSFRPAIVGRILSTKALVSLGLMSYSLYLWHWPILAYQRYWFGEILTVSSRIVALSLSVFIAYISWKYVERPFRKGGSVKSGKKVVSLAFSCFMCLIVVSLWISNAKGLPGRIPDRALQYIVSSSIPQGFAADTDSAGQGDLPQLGSWNDTRKPIAFLVWGDSHAYAISELCNTLAREHDIRGAIAARASTVPLLGTWRPSSGRQAVEWNQSVLEFVKSGRISNVILVARWAGNIEGQPNGKMNTLIVDEYSNDVCPEESKAALRRGFERTIAALKAVGVNVWVMKQVPLQATDPTKSLVLAVYFGRRPPTGVTIETHMRRQSNVNEILDSLASSNLRILDPTDYCFDASGLSKIGDAESSFYFDENHLSKCGAEILLRPLLEPVFERIAVHSKGVYAQVQHRPQNLHAAGGTDDLPQQRCHRQ